VGDVVGVEPVFGFAAGELAHGVVASFQDSSVLVRASMPATSSLAVRCGGGEPRCEASDLCLELFECHVVEFGVVDGQQAVGIGHGVVHYRPRSSLVYQQKPTARV
jgi:hypothetical protein